MKRLLNFLGTSSDNVKNYIYIENQEGGPNIGNPIGVWGAAIITLGIIFGAAILFKTF